MTWHTAELGTGTPSKVTCAIYDYITAGLFSFLPAPYLCTLSGLVHLSAMEYLRNNNSDLIVLTSPPRSGKPPRFTLSVEQLGELNEKAPADTSPQLPYPPDSSCSAAQSSAQWTPYSYHDSDLTTQYPLSPPSPRSSQFIRPLSSHRTSYSPCPRCPALVSVLRPWTPLIMYAISSLTFVIAIAFYKTELFQCMLSCFFHPQSLMIAQ